MSARYPGGFITQTPTAPTNLSAPGVWTLDQQAQYKKAGTWPYAGPFTYIENVFSTYLYSGNSSTQTITNDIDLSTKGGLVWIKSRSNSTANKLTDTARGVTKALRSENSAAQTTDTNGLTAFNTTGFSLGTDSIYNGGTSITYVSWTFRKQTKFFDIVTWTGDGVAGRNIAHSLGSTPGCMIVKAVNGTDSYRVYHQSIGATGYLQLDQDTGANYSSSPWNNTSPTSTQFTVSDSTNVNGSGVSYVAYLFAHDAGGFGLSNADNVISCGSLITNGSGSATVTLGYEPQFILVKNIDSNQNWFLVDTMRGWDVASSFPYGDAILEPNLTASETITGTFGYPTATGFVLQRTGSTNYIYIVIRRGPMKVPTVGTTVFTPVTYTGDSVVPRTITTNIVTDLIIGGSRSSFSGPTNDRLRGQVASYTTDTGVESSNSVFPRFDVMDGYINLANGGDFNSTGNDYIRWAFRRAPSFFDEVCYTGTGATNIQTHNLGVLPTLIIIKSRSAVSNWVTTFLVGTAGYRFWTGTTFTGLNATFAAVLGFTNTTQITSTTFDPQSFVTSVNLNTNTYVAYLFATCPGVSKVGTYTGTGALQTVNCGFTSGARFVLIKRYDSTGDWYTYDSARGISSGNDPYIFMNSASAAEVTGTNYVDTDTTGFKVTAAAPAGLNANGGSYLFLAIA